MRFSKPNSGLVGRMNLMQRRMIRRGLQEDIITNVGLVLVTVVPGLSVNKLATNRSENEYWLTGEDDVLNIQVAKDIGEIETMFNSMTL